MQSVTQLENRSQVVGQTESTPTVYGDRAFGPNTCQQPAGFSAPTAGTSKYTTRRLVRDDEVRMAQNLVYQVYVEELGWIPDADNPSGIRFAEHDGTPLFIDDYEETATWIGTFDGDRLVACWRWCRPIDGLYEIERYHPLPAELTAARAMEVNRLVIDPDYRTRGRVFYHLVRETYKLVSPVIDFAFCAVAFPDPGELYLKIGLKPAECPAFKYSPKDAEEVRVLALDLRDQSTLAAGRRDRESRRETTADVATAC
jgi:hypothetical protein